MRILILCREDDREDYDQTETYKKALGLNERANSYDYGEYESLFFHYDGKNLTVRQGDNDIAEYDAIFMVGWFKSKILEDIALSAAMYANQHKVKVWNSEVLYTRSRSKLSQYVAAVINQVSVTPFMFCKNSTLFQSYVDRWSGGYPVIAKGVLANKGNDNYKLADKTELSNILSNDAQDEGPWFIVQKFVPNNGDYRVIITGEEIKLVIHRRSVSESHLNNTSKGGEAAIVALSELPMKVQNECLRLSKALKREVAGVDMIKHSSTGEFYLLEINNMPQLATGAFVSEKMNMIDDYFKGAV